ncbi:phosphomannomutase/phosphoglucomutase [Candidatus Magnetaquicoccus inordinatus]|uniref:phosphomannomutase/phosphoglucomutase n=1 Tax=Candidatus Magnetaquicoccus inordinatus TaxID=2496818 RepID=UPI00102BBD81|nr:phosphomannomutase/phosphoglucomutase [Candidatus Magnetaquicoccus inordinatus]
MVNLAHIFREYDIRGVAGSELSESLVRDLGIVFAAHVQELRSRSEPMTIVIGRDGRHSSPSLAKALAEGLAYGGAIVIDCGLLPTPALYFANHHFNADAAIMLTGSHNPPEYNGLKMVRDGRSVYGQEIQLLRQRLQNGAVPLPEAAEIRSGRVLERYLQRILADYSPGRSIQVVLDCGNGATGVVAPELLNRLPGVAGEVLYAEVDGNFPNHHPDPTIPANLQALWHHMQETDAELGIAFDGDGDRIGALDEKGKIVWGDRLMILFARQILAKQPGATIIGDVKCSQLLFDAVAEAGGEPLMWKTGHSLVKTKMRETAAPLGGEMSGHLFFADRYLGYDDALYAAVRLIELVASGPETLSERLRNLPESFSSPELRLECPDDRKFQVMERIRLKLEAQGSSFSAIDGVRVHTPQGWWLLRVSNTQPALVARMEATSREHLQLLAQELAAILADEKILLPEWQEA